MKTTTTSKKTKARSATMKISNPPKDMMSDEAFKDYIRPICTKLKQHFILNEYHMALCWCGGKEDDRDEECLGTNSSIEDSNVVHATFAADFRYLRFIVHMKDGIYDSYKKKDWTAVGQTLTHEFCHAVIDPLFFFGHERFSKENQDIFNDIRERQTQRMAYTLFQFLPASLWLPQKDGKSHKPKRK